MKHTLFKKMLSIILSICVFAGSITWTALEVSASPADMSAEASESTENSEMPDTIAEGEASGQIDTETAEGEEPEQMNPETAEAEEPEQVNPETTEGKEPEQMNPEAAEGEEPGQMDAKTAEKEEPEQTNPDTAEEEPISQDTSTENQTEENMAEESAVMLTSALGDTHAIVTPGNIANVVVFVDFQDTDHTEHISNLGGECFTKNAQTTFQMFNGDADHPRGMRQYLQNISYGKLEVANIFPQYDENTGKITPYKLACNTDYYFDNDGLIIREVLQQLERTGGLKENADRDGDGFIDNLTIVVPCEQGNKNEKFYGHKAFYSGEELVNGYRTGTYNLLPEYGVYLGLSGSGVIIHEFLHTVGYPDLYRDSSGDPVWLWDIMSKPSEWVQYPLAYFRSTVSGWIDIPTIKESKEKYSLYAASAATEETKNQQAVILKTDYSDTEFFVLEYRKQGDRYNGKDYDSQIPGSGLIIYRINTSYETNKAGAPDMVYVYRPGDQYDDSGNELGEGEKNKSFLSAESGRTSYGSSDLSKSLKDGAITYSDGTNSGIVISNVGSAGGDQIVFDITFSDTSEGEYWTPAAVQGADDASCQMDSWMDTDGTIYYLQRKGDLSGPVYLYKYDGKNWSKCSSALSVAGYNFSLEKYNGNFYAGYMSMNAARQYEFRLSRWNGAKWDTVYTSPIPSNEFAMAADTDGIYLVYSSEDNKYLYACKYTESGVSTLGKQICQSSYASNLSLDAENGKIVVMYREVFNGNRLFVKKYDQTKQAWNDVGNLTLKANSGAVKLHKGRIYLLKNGSGNLGEDESDMYLYDLTSAAGTWGRVGNNSYATESISDITICFHEDAPHIIYQEGSGKKVQVMSLVNNQWTVLGSRVTGELVSGLEGYSHAGNIYVTYLSNVTKRAYIKYHQSDNTSPVPGATGGSSGENPGGTTGGSGNTGGTTGGSGSGNTGGTTGGSGSGNTGSTTGGSGNTGSTTGGNSGGSGTETKPPVVKPTEPQKPVNTSEIKTLTVTMTTCNTLQLSWNQVPGAISYDVYYSNQPNSGFKKLKSVKKNNYKFTKAKCGQTYYFKVRVCKKSGKKKTYGDFCPAESGRTVLTGTPSVYVSKTTYNSVTIKWKKVKDAKKYEIYYASSPEGPYRLLKTQGGNSYTHKKLRTGETYYYKVRPMRDSYTGAFSSVTSGKTVLGTLSKLKVSASGTGRLKISWKKVPGADYYVILRANTADGEYQQIGTTKKTSYVNMGLPASTTYYYKVYAVAGPYQTNTAGPVGRTTKASKR